MMFLYMNLIGKGIYKAIGRIGVSVFRWLPTKLFYPSVNLFFIIPEKRQWIDIVWEIAIFALIQMMFIKEIGSNLRPDSLLERLKEKILSLLYEKWMAFHNSGLKRGFPRGAA